jgi:hypothetical protein
VTARCIGSKWELYRSTCNPPPPEPCNVVEPKPGESCAPADRCAMIYRSCEYGDCSGKPERIYECDVTTLTWKQTADVYCTTP